MVSCVLAKEEEITCFCCAKKIEQLGLHSPTEASRLLLLALPPIKAASADFYYLFSK